MTNSRRPPRSTYDRALDMLEARARGVTELRRLLLKKGEPEPDVDAAIARLQSTGLLDDNNFARQFTRSKAVGAGLSRRRVQQELTRRGVARDVADHAIEEVFDEEGVDEDESIERVARKKLRMLAKVDEPTRKRRLFAFLARRGYDSDDISRVVRTLLLEGADDVTV
jgi:regulatory protein